ncbi:MAG TPA: sugar porter family MFS transporter [Terracidiphilus sp.]|nr:sugar porter family MFS transporter [Terracidiphilus sp.]
MRPNLNLMKATLTGALGGLLFGFDTVVIAGAIGALVKLYALDPHKEGLTVAIGLVGTVIGALGAGQIGQRLGSRETLRLTAILYVVSAAGCAFAWNWDSFLVFRFIGGLGIGASSVLGPVYIAELSPAKWRGRFVALFQFNVVFGIMLAYLSNYVIRTMHLGATEWRWQVGIAGIPAVAFLIMLFGIPRSPRWSASRDRIDEALEVLKLMGDPDPEAELADIREALKQEHASAHERVFKWKYRYPLFLAISIGAFNQLAGINAILYYINDIFASAGYSQLSGDQKAIAIGATNLIFTMVGMSVIDKLGRKTLLLIGAAGTAACLAGVAWIFSSNTHQSMLVWILVTYIGFFALSQGAVIWVYIGEVFPTSVRSKGQGVGSASHWFMNAAIAETFPVVVHSMSTATPFIFFSIMTAIQFFTVFFTYPETKGQTLEALQRKLVAAD